MKFYVHKLGCPKNDVDADYISARLIDDGHTPVARPEEADSIVVNTCGFIRAAKEESIHELLRLGELKKSGNGQGKTLYASGCLSQRYGNEMLKEMPELDGAFGLGALDSISRAVREKARYNKLISKDSRQLAYLSWKHRYISDGYPYAYLKISDGCDRKCTYCAIPGMRGKFRSRPMESILREAQYLADNGKRELILVSQEATLYGYGLPGNTSILDLLRELDRIEGIRWIRLMYLYPSAVNQRLLDYMADDNKTLNYLDLPLQHVNTEILSAMRRQVDRPTIERLLRKIRGTGVPATVRTTFIVGFPGETEAQFEELCDFVEEYRFDRMGVFTYSPEEGTPAQEFDKQIPETVKVKRMDCLMSIQQDLAFELNNSLLGSTLEVIIDEVDDNGVGHGRSQGDCPEIDQSVFAKGENIAAGDICRVRIDSAEGYDLWGTRHED